MTLSIDICLVLHWGRGQLQHAYHIKETMIKSAVSMKDPSVMQSANYGYEGQCQAITAKANKVVGMMRHSFPQKSPKLLQPAFQYYVAPTLLYCSPAWRPYLHEDNKLLERVQRRYTKYMNGLEELA